LASFLQHNLATCPHPSAQGHGAFIALENRDAAVDGGGESSNVQPL